MSVIATMRAGNVDAFAEIVEHYQVPIVRYLYRLTGDYELARDLAQDTFVQAYKAILKTGSDLRLKAWLYRIATNNAFQHHRKKKSSAAVRYDIDLGSGIAFQNPNSLTENAEIQEILLEIPEKLRVCMVLHFIDGFKYREIATMLRVSEDAVRMRVARGSDEFRKLFNAEGGDVR